jgi:hypothetical protein
VIFAEAKKFSVELANLFPGSQVNEAQGREITRALMDFEEKNVRAAVRDHHRRFEFINYPELYKACKTPAVPYADPNKRAIPDMNFAEIVRQQRPDMASATDFEVLLRYWQADWHRYELGGRRRLDGINEHTQQKTAELKLRLSAIDNSVEGVQAIRDEIQSALKQIPAAAEAVWKFQKRQFDGYRNKCRVGCITTLCSHGMLWADAENWAESIFAEPGHFRACLAELRGELAVPARA